ncbi:Chloroperoxidase [Xylariaceae sp. FL0804]|nr:Chloroperoxidase [Xylariaceae sp. FL0804]
MSSSRASLTSAPLAKGTYCSSTSSDIRSPCPLINCLANHGYIPRDGRDVRASELAAAMNEVGLSTALGAVFSRPIFLEHQTSDQSSGSVPNKSTSLWGAMWYYLRNPWAILFSMFGMRRPGQTDTMGKRCLNLDQLGLPGVVEHDISLTRHDYHEGDNIKLQPDLLKDLLASSSDGKALTGEDLAGLRKRRIEKQNEVNPSLNYGSLQHMIACTEIALVLNVFGDGKQVPFNYARAFFQEERLPTEEGWRKRRWWSLGFVELGRTVSWIKELVG